MHLNRYRRLHLTNLVGLALVGPLSGSSPQEATAATTSQDPLAEIVQSVLQPGAAMMADIDQRPAMVLELLRIASDDQQASELQLANAVVHEAFGGVYVHGQSFIGSAPETPGLVFTQTLSIQPISDYREWAIEPAWIGLSPTVQGVNVALYTGRFGQGPEHIGVKVVTDHAVVANQPCAGQPGCTSISYTPFDLIDPNSPILAQDAGEFLQASVRGDFDDPTALHDWFTSRVVVPTVLDGQSGGGSDGAACSCDIIRTRECLYAAELYFFTESMNVQQTYGPRVAEATEAIAPYVKDFVTKVTAGAIEGAKAGAMSGTAGGPLNPASSFLGALFGGANGAAAGAVGWAMSNNLATVAQLAVELEAARAAAKQAACDVFRNSADMIKNCFRETCPDLLDNAYFIADHWVAINGC